MPQEKSVLNKSLTDDQMEAIINMLFMYKKINPNQDIYFNEQTIMKIMKTFNKFN